MNTKMIAVSSYQSVDFAMVRYPNPKNINKLSQVFQCPECNPFLSEAKKMSRHSLICNKGNPKIIFEEGNYKPTSSVFEKLEVNGIIVSKELRFYPYFIFY
jgi:hypothetical protein